jgi:uncharacterized membrane protein
MRIPLFSSLCKACQEILKTFFDPERTCLQQVVLVPLQTPGVFTLGFIAKNSPKPCNAGTQKEAFKYIISCDTLHDIKKTLDEDSHV